MARKVDPELEARRDRAVEALSQAGYLIGRVRPRCQTLHSGTWHEVSGTGIGDEMVARAHRSVEGADRIASLLAQARSAARGIDVTVEVPDDEEES